LIGILRENLIYQTLGFTTYPGYGIPIRDLDNSRALNLCYRFQRTDPLESLHHSPFTIHTMVSYMLSNTHMIDKFLDKDKIEIDGIFSDVCKIQTFCILLFPGYNLISLQISDKSLSYADELSSLGDTLWMERYFSSILLILYKDQ